MFTLDHRSQFFYPSRLAMTLGLLVALGLMPQPLYATGADKTDQAIIGYVTFLIGSVKLKPISGVEEQLSKGSPIRVGDQLITQEGGHAHILFVDGARISLRPLSRLTIQDYSQGLAKNGEKAIRFRLDEGVVRSMTGAWGEAMRERFRLNTPLAAIGIKGTDFVVKADPNRTLASVMTGAIVMAPMDAQCRSTLGACNNERSLVLSDAMRGQLLELQRGQIAPVLIPAFDLMSRNDAGLIKRSTLSGDKDTGNRVEGAVSKTESGPTNGELASQNSTLGAGAVTTATTVVNNKEALLWMRYPWAQRITGDDFVQTFESAKNAGLQVIISNGAYTLYRDAGTNPVFAPNTTSANFQLTHALASLYSPATFSNHPIEVSSGVLAVNFVNNTFNTSLNLSSPMIGETSVVAQGIVASNGNLASRSGNAEVFGGFNYNATRAGYQFDKAVPQGAIHGITLWGR